MFKIFNKFVQKIGFNYQTLRKMADNNKQANYIIRQMKESDFDIVRQNWTTLNFFASIYDNHVMAEVDPKGLFVVEEVGTGKIIGECSGINHSPDLSFIGQYGILPEYQNLGIGQELFRKVLEHIGPERNAGLYSREEMANKYRDGYKFTLYPTYSKVYSGKPDLSQLTQEVDGVSVIPIDETNIEKVIQYDRKVYSLDRTPFLKKLTSFDDYVSRVAVGKSGDVLGYCVLTISNFNSALPEPLYADNERIAELLLSKCCQQMSIARNGMIFPATDANPKSVAIATKLGLNITRNGALQYTRRLFLGDMERVFCGCSRCFYPF